MINASSDSRNPFLPLARLCPRQNSSSPLYNRANKGNQTLSHIIKKIQYFLNLISQVFFPKIHIKAKQLSTRVRVAPLRVEGLEGRLLHQKKLCEVIKVDNRFLRFVDLKELSILFEKEKNAKLKKGELRLKFSEFLQSWKPQSRDDISSELREEELRLISLIAEIDQYLTVTQLFDERYEPTCLTTRSDQPGTYIFNFINNMEDSFREAFDILKSRDLDKIVKLFSKFKEGVDPDQDFTFYPIFYKFTQLNSSRCRTLIPDIFEFLESRFTLTYSDCDVIIYIFAPLLLTCELSETQAEKLFQRMTQVHPFPEYIFEPLIKKCLYHCPKLKTEKRIPIFQGFLKSHTFPINFETSQLMLSLQLDSRNVFSACRKILISALTARSSFTKNYLYELLIYLLKKQPKIFNIRDLASTSFNVLEGVEVHSSIPSYVEDIDRNFAQMLIVDLHDKQAITLSPIQKEILKRGLIQGSKPWEYFKDKGLFVNTDILMVAHPSLEDLPLALAALTENLFAERVKGHLAPNRTDYELILKAHSLKKVLKRLDIQSFQEKYDRFLEIYDRIVSHVPILALVQSLSQEIRSIIRDRSADPSTTLRKFLVLWGDERSYEVNFHAIGDHIKLAPVAYKMALCQARRKICIVANQFFSDPFWQSNNYRHMCVHGTKAGTLHMITRFPKDERALHAAGQLIRSGIPPLTGELSGSHTEHNKDRISFSFPSLSWNDPLWELGLVQIFKAPTPYCQSILYALKTSNPHGSNSSFTFSPDETLVDLLRACSEEELNPNIAILKIMQIKATHPSADTVLEPLKLHIEKLRTQTRNPLLYKDVYQALIQPPRLRLSSDDVKQVQDPIPIVFGVFSHFDPSTRVFNREITFPTGLNLGINRDASIIFAKDEDIGHVERKVGDTDMKVHGLNELLLSESLIMTEGGEADKLNLRLLSEETLQPTIGKAVIQFAAPYYATPLPKAPTAPSAGSNSLCISDRFFLDRPCYGDGYNSASYYSALESSPQMVVREYHGVMHMLRTTLFSQIFLNIFNPGSDLKMRFLTALSAAFHDSAREDEGVDRWDEMSAWNLRHFLMLFNSPIRDDSGLLSENIIISQVEIAMCYKALSKKDPPKSEGFKSDLQKSVHDADCIEIIRCLSDPSEFKASELQAASVLPKEKLDLFIQEAILFIKNTESLEVKTHYEHFSRDPYGELLDYLQTNAALYPKMNFYFSLKN